MLAGISIEKKKVDHSKTFDESVQLSVFLVYAGVAKNCHHRTKNCAKHFYIQNCFSGG